MPKKIVFLIISMISCGAFAKMPQIPPSFVETTVVQEGTKQEQISSTGTLTASQGIVVKPEIPGRISKIYFKSGDAVKAGTPLVEINSDLIKAQLKEAQAALQLAKTDFNRFSDLYKTHDVSKAEFDRAQANYNSMQAKIESVQALLNQANIMAPFSGKLGITQVNVGAFVNAGQPIVNLQALDPLMVDFSVPETYLGRIAVGQVVLMKSDAYPQEIFSGKVEAFESVINQSNRTLNVRASIQNKDEKLLPGAFVEVVLQFAPHNKLIMIPQTAIIYSADGNYVFTVVAGKAVKTPVILGEKDKDNIEVKSGLNVGDVIVTAGQLKAHEGAPVVVANK